MPTLADTTTITDRIEKEVVLQAPVERVWRAISDSKEFGRWFGASFEGLFAPHRRVTARIVPTAVDDEIAKLQKPHEGKPFEITVERVEPLKRFSFRWHPFAMNASVDYSHEPKTLIVFALEEVPGGTRLTITESGFDRLPPSRRHEAFEANEGGWAKQTELLEKYLGHAARGR
jgi:uncharacterized protein YndB with AHSA1/START domain